jgi:hypothetical protein
MLQQRLRPVTFLFASWQPVKSMMFTYVDALMEYQPLYLALVYLSFSKRATAVFAESRWKIWL